MKVLVACEESQTVCKAFRDRGHEAYSADILECSGGHPEWHLLGDVLGILGNGWDLMIAHPPCTHLAVSGARWFKQKREDGRQQKAVDFFLDIVKAPIPKICVENPVCIMSGIYRGPDQYIQPWQFGHGETKKTGLWLVGLPDLKPTNIVDGREARIHRLPPSKDRARLRSVTFQGIADAMADQWG